MMSSPLLVVTIEKKLKNALIQESAQNLGTTAEGFCRDFSGHHMGIL